MNLLFFAPSCVEACALRATTSRLSERIESVINSLGAGMHPQFLVPAATFAEANDAATVETIRAWPLYCNVNVNGNRTAV
jgi:hypothetical protein